LEHSNTEGTERFMTETQAYFQFPRQIHRNILFFYYLNNYALQP